MFVAGCAGQPVVGAPAEATSDRGAAVLEGRLLAPCCWNQTLDTHESDLASSLRAEIRGRLQRGEASATIEDDLAARYGERIRAVPKGRDPRTTLAVCVALAMALSAPGLFWLVRRSTRRIGRTAVDAVPARERDDYDERLDAELRALDEG
jgi:cytochrome c-type biogenesis protein CcmH